MKYCFLNPILLTLSLALFAGCSGSDAKFTGWQTQEFGRAEITSSTTRALTLANPSNDSEQHIRAIAFDRGSNFAGHFSIEKVSVNGRQIGLTDIIVPPGGTLLITVAYAPKSLTTSQGVYGGWVTGENKPWVPTSPEEAENFSKDKVRVHRAIIEMVYDYPSEGIYYFQLVGEPLPGPNGEVSLGGGQTSCTPGGGIACYNGGFSIDVPQLSPGGLKALEMTGPIKFSLDGSVVNLKMDDFPYVIYYLRSSEIPQLPGGVNATLVISGAQDAEASGTFDGSRLTVDDVTFRIRVALGELTKEDLKRGMAAIVDFEIPGLKVTTIRPLSDGVITLHLETSLPSNPSGNPLFDQFLSGVKIIAAMEGEFTF